jgi:rhamnulokinase
MRGRAGRPAGARGSPPGHRVLAIDLGAGSGRAVAASVLDDRLETQEVSRFEVRSAAIAGGLVWNIVQLFHDVDAAIDAAASAGPVRSVGIDGWAIDFGLLDASGELVAMPRHYRDPRNAAAMAEVLTDVAPEQLYARTGIQIMRINTLFQLRALARQSPGIAEAADRLLLIPDLLHTWLGGEPANEVTNASTTQLLSVGGSWAYDLLETTGMPPRVLQGTPIEPGTELGPLRGRADRPAGAAETRVVAPASHDTASAVIGIPGLDSSTAFVSSGTWSLVGMELPEPVVSDTTFRANLSNERGIGGTTRLLRNVMGLWLLAECRRHWVARGIDPAGWDSLLRDAAVADPFALLFDPDDPALLEPGDLPGRIAQLAGAPGIELPPAQLTRSILECLALKTRLVVDSLEQATGRTVSRLALVGGGSRNALLCALTANASGRPVDAGPAEATSLGNAGVQLIAAGALGTVADLRELIGLSARIAHYEPTEHAAWDDAIGRFRRCIGQLDAGRPTRRLSQAVEG